MGLEITGVNILSAIRDTNLLLTAIIKRLDRLELSIDSREYDRKYLSGKEDQNG